MANTSARVEFGGPHSRGISRGLAAAADSLSKFDTCIAALAILEAAVVIFAAAAAKFFYIHLFIGNPQPWLPYLGPAPLLASTLYLFMKRAGLYDSSAVTQPVVPYGRIYGTLVTSFLLLLGILYTLKFADWYSRGWFLMWFGMSAFLLITVRIFGMHYLRRMVAQGRIRQRIAIFGDPDFLGAMKDQVESADPSAAIEGIYLAPSNAHNQNLLSNGGLDELKSAIERDRYDTIIIGFPADEIARIKVAVSDLASYSIELLLCTKLDSNPTIIRGTRRLGTLRTDIVNLVPLSESNRVLKAALDYILAGVGLLLLSPLLFLIAVAIKLDSRGPVFFRQRRYGQNNRIFRIFKFRTMFVAEDGQQIKQAERNDPRVTRVGWFLRRTSLDELPQLLNVLTGDMSIVGPRPHALIHDQLFEQQFDLFSLRRRVRPGLTGWAQVHGFRGETKTPLDIRKRVEHDLYYIDNWSVWFDIEIMTRTIFVLFRGAF
ncbi:undecaprenyl-phosphate glucose phosphotransferase [Hyphomicrobium sp.]|uniref:undecaprenyl-phosphate glucose phosphotransferase n=1 Tax=Hyphomicrobium sp. TaxID=82 RepID=UPI002D7785B3|nr:undecaprenyl-phosphate glucose phosphotransferase [Hyphomicrobium sp.]HET6389423.1 undecaprenyl-phosphate glucose phosphotransferase [Hyphomicrobium sp.]